MYILRKSSGYNTSINSSSTTNTTLGYLCVSQIDWRTFQGGNEDAAIVDMERTHWMGEDGFFVSLG
jgi:hypothetical protein